MRQTPKEECFHTFRNTKISGCANFQFDKKGYLTVETAIFLPIFIIGVLTFAYLIKFMSVQEGILHSFTDEARILCAEASFNPLDAPLFEPKLADRIYDENGNSVSGVNVEHFLYLYPARGISGLISMDLSYDVNVKLPIPFYEKLPVSESLLFRGFIGREDHNLPMSFTEMEKEKKSELVWVFPRAGGKYHSENCTYISSEPKQMVMSAQIRRKYSRCSLCNSETLQDGRLVYCFKTGSSYHTGDCPIVDKYVISMEKDGAIKDGYTVCTKCGGI